MSNSVSACHPTIYPLPGDIGESGLPAGAVIETRRIETSGLLKGGGALTGDRQLSVEPASLADTTDGTRSDAAITPATLIPALQAALSGPTPASLPPRRGQFLAAVEASGAGRVATAYGSVPSDPSDPLNRAWFHTVFVTPPCVLAQFVKSTFDLTDAQLATIISNARSVAE